ncbi:hypothetical protein [Neobacillus sp. Marseille-QA0830]
MANYFNKTDDELERLDSNGDHEAGHELENRGYVQDRYGIWVDEEDNDDDEDSGFGLVLFIIGAILVVAALLCTQFLVAYSVDYQIYVYIGFFLAFLFMILGRGTSKFCNVLFLIGCWAMATRLYPYVVEAIEGVEYGVYFGEQTRSLWDWIKYGLIYVAYASLVPYLLMKIITFIVSAYMTKEPNETTNLKG